MPAVRPAHRDDIAVLTAMLVEAANWDDARAPLSYDDVTARHEFSHYVDGWPRPRDFGFVATADDGRAIGAAWCRRFTADDPGFGFVDEATPELSIGIAREWRGRGIGHRLLEALAADAAHRRVGAVSLSVEKANRARRLYERHGFVPVRDDGDAITMRLSLPARPASSMDP